MASLPPLPFTPLLARIQPALPPDTPIYLVGGAVRDALLGEVTHDLDFALPGDALAVARSVADSLGGAYYPLDHEHGAGRVVFEPAGQEQFLLDFTTFRGPDLEADLRARDFTINAMAVSARAPDEVWDPLGGAADLRAGRLRACGPTALADDPLRVMRGVRLATALRLEILPETRQLMRAAADGLPAVSPERQRDELWRLLEGPRCETAMRALEVLDILPHVLPELASLKDVEQPPPHVTDVWNHTLRALRALAAVLEVLGGEHDPEAAADLRMGMLSLRLGRYREQISAHLQTAFTPQRTLRPLLFFAALYHDVGKPETAEQDEHGRIRFFEHPRVGARVVARRARQLRLSRKEGRRLETIVRHHMRPLLLTQLSAPPTRRAIYRFFRDTEAAGVDIAVLSMADTLATYGASLPEEVWSAHLGVVRALLNAWWEAAESQVAPPPLLDGNDLQAVLGLQPGPRIGRLLDHLREAQATGRVRDREEALDAARAWLAWEEAEQGGNPPPEENQG